MAAIATTIDTEKTPGDWAACVETRRLWSRVIYPVLCSRLLNYRDLIGYL